MLFLSIFEYIYIRWRVSRSVSIDIDQDDDSLASSSDESIKSKSKQIPKAEFEKFQRKSYAPVHYTTWTVQAHWEIKAHANDPVV